MRIGFNLLLWTTHVTEEHFPILADLKRTGYDGIEVPLFEGDLAHFRKVGRALSDQGLAATGVTVLPDEAHSAISPDAASRQGALDRLRWAVDCLHACGGTLLGGPFHQPLGVFTGEPPTAAELDRLVEVHVQAADHAAQAGIALSVEPLNRFECYVLNTVADAAALVARVGRPNYGLLYDTFHANIEEKHPIGVIRPHIAQINHVHISENDRGTPGKGHVPLAMTFAVLKEGGYDGWLTIEAFGRALPALAAATRVWRDFFPSREEVYRHGFRVIRDGWAAA
jgi:D-psicose/D-tagatose/L-ribulose 3-epimerase